MIFFMFFQKYKLFLKKCFSIFHFFWRIKFTSPSPSKKIKRVNPTKYFFMVTKYHKSITGMLWQQMLFLVLEYFCIKKVLRKKYFFLVALWMMHVFLCFKIFCYWKYFWVNPKSTSESTQSQPKVNPNNNFWVFILRLTPVTSQCSF